MGIKELFQFLKKRNDSLVRELPIDIFYGKKIAIDISIYLYKYICIENRGQGKWLDMFVNLCMWLRKHNLRPVFIFDGKPPVEKEETQKERRALRQLVVDKMQKIQEYIDKCESNTLTDSDSRVVSELLENKNARFWDTKEMLTKLREKYTIECSKNIVIEPRHINTLKEYLTLVGLPWFVAPGEAERTCSWLGVHNYVDAVMTLDSDAVAYGSPIVIREIFMTTDTCSVCELNNILTDLELNYDQFLDFCIMCGTDYNIRIPKCGPANAYKLIKKYGSFKHIIWSADVDIEKLKYDRCRQLFTLPTADDPISTLGTLTVKLPLIKPVDTNKLVDFLSSQNSRWAVSDIIRNIPNPKFSIKIDT